MRFAGISLVILLVVSAIACSGETPEPTATTEPPTPTPDVPATVEAGIAATREAELSIEATITARVEATKAAEPTATPIPTPTPLPSPTLAPIIRDEKLVNDFFQCLESNLAVAAAFTSTYDGPLREQVQTVLNSAGDLTGLLDDLGAFRAAMYLAMDSEPLVRPAIIAINLGCSHFGSDERQETHEPENTSTPQPNATSSPVPTHATEHRLTNTRCQELVPEIIELSQDRDLSGDAISEIVGVEEISDNLLVVECKGLSHTASGQGKWIKFHKNRLGILGYETLKAEYYECVFLVPKIIELSKGHDWEVLGISDIEELSERETT